MIKENQKRMITSRYWISCVFKALWISSAEPLIKSSDLASMQDLNLPKLFCVLLFMSIEGRIYTVIVGLT